MRRTCVWAYSSAARFCARVASWLRTAARCFAGSICISGALAGTRSPDLTKMRVRTPSTCGWTLVVCRDLSVATYSVASRSWVSATVITGTGIAIAPPPGPPGPPAAPPWPPAPPPHAASTPGTSSPDSSAAVRDRRRTLSPKFIGTPYPQEISHEMLVMLRCGPGASEPCLPTKRAKPRHDAHGTGRGRPDDSPADYTGSLGFSHPRRTIVTGVARGAGAAAELSTSDTPSDSFCCGRSGARGSGPLAPRGKDPRVTGGKLPAPAQRLPSGGGG